MNRRGFLQAIATIAAATATTDLSALLAPTTSNQVPVIDWTQWNQIRLSHVGGKVVGFVNEVEVSSFPEIMKKLCGYIYFDGECIRLSSSGVADRVQGHGFRYIVPEIDGEAPLTFGCVVKMADEHVISQPYFADLYITDDKEIPKGCYIQPPTEEELANNWDGQLNRGEGKGLKIVSAIPKAGSVTLETWPSEQE